MNLDESIPKIYRYGKDSLEEIIRKNPSFTCIYVSLNTSEYKDKLGSIVKNTKIRVQKSKGDFLYLISDKNYVDLQRYFITESQKNTKECNTTQKIIPKEEVTKKAKFNGLNNFFIKK